MHCISFCGFVVAIVSLPSNVYPSVLNTPGFVRNDNFRFIDVCKKSASRVTSNRTRTLNSPSPAYCARHCLADPTCSSFNWKRADRLCELIPDSDENPVFQKNTNFVHYSPYVCPGVTPPPKQNWTGEWERINGSDIMVCRQKEPTVSWTTARHICKGMQADLIDLTKPGRTSLIASVAKGKKLQAWIGCRLVNTLWKWVSSDMDCAPSLNPYPDHGHKYAYVNIYIVAELVPVPVNYTRDSFICEK